MNIAQAKAVTREWVHAYRPVWPGLRAAHLVGGITTLADCTELPTTRDIDVHLIFDEGSPMLESNGPFPNIVEVTYRGLPIEAGVTSMAAYASPEVVLANPEIAHHLTVESSLYDPEGVLAALQVPVTREYARRRWVRARVQHEREGFAAALGLLERARAVYGASGEANLFGYLTTYLVAALSVANLDPPRIGGQMLVRIRPLLQQVNRLDLIEELLELLGVRCLGETQAVRYLNAAAEAFDLAVTIRRTPHPFQHKMHAHLRPYFVDSCQEMIQYGYPREALAWITPCLCSATDIIQIDGRDEDTASFVARRDAFLRTIGFTTPEAGARKLALAMDLHDRIFALADEIIATHPDIRD